MVEVVVEVVMEVVVEVVMERAATDLQCPN